MVRQKVHVLSNTFLPEGPSAAAAVFFPLFSRCCRNCSSHHFPRKKSSFNFPAAAAPLSSLLPLFFVLTPFAPAASVEISATAAAVVDAGLLAGPRRRRQRLAGVFFCTLFPKGV